MNYKNIVLLALLSAFNLSGFCSELTPLQKEIAAMKLCIAHFEEEYKTVAEAAQKQNLADGIFWWSDRFLNLISLQEHKKKIIKELKSKLRILEITQLEEDLKNGSLL
jgi:hypothetical protein